MPAHFSVPPLYQIKFNRTLHCVEMEWQGYSSDEAFRVGTERMLSLLIENQSTRVLADLSNMKLISLRSREWILQDFLPRALNAGLRVMAFVRSEDYYNQLSIGTVVYEIDPAQLTVEYFYHRSEAERWLQEQ